VKSASADTMTNSSYRVSASSASTASSTRLMSALLLPCWVSDGQSTTWNPARVKFGRNRLNTDGLR
jgi:hypothetical protein